VGIGVGVDEGVETSVAADWPIGTIPTSSGRSEGEGVVRFGLEESDVVVRGLAATGLVWAEAGKLNNSVMTNEHPQRGRWIWNSRITRQLRVLTQLNFRS